MINKLLAIILFLSGWCLPSLCAGDIYTDLDGERSRIKAEYPSADIYWHDNLTWIKNNILSKDLYRLNFLLRSIKGDNYTKFFDDGFMDHLLFFIPTILKYEFDEEYAVRYVKENPLLSLYAFPFYFDQPYAEKAIKEIVAIIPEEFMQNQHLWIQTKHADHIIPLIASVDPKTLASYVKDDNIRQILAESDSISTYTFLDIYRNSGSHSNVYLLQNLLWQGNSTYQAIYKQSSDPGSWMDNCYNKEIPYISLFNAIRSEAKNIYTEEPDTTSPGSVFLELLYCQDRIEPDLLVHHTLLLSNWPERFRINFENPQMLESCFLLMDRLGQFGYYSKFVSAINENDRYLLEDLYLERRKRIRINFEFFDRSPSALFTSTVGPNFRYSEKERYLIHLQKDPESAFKALKHFRQDHLGQEFLARIAISKPELIFKHLYDFSEEPYALMILENAALIDPVTAKRYLSSDKNLAQTMLNMSRNLELMKLKSIHSEYKMLSNSYLLLDEIIKGKLDKQESHTIGFYKEMLYKKLVEIRPTANKATVSIDKYLSNYVLMQVRSINNDIENASADRFGIMQDFTAEEIYFFVVYGEEELLNSTFKGIFNRFLSTDESRKIEFLRQRDYFRLGTFLKICAEHEVIYEYLDNFSSSNRSLIYNRVIPAEVELDDAIEIAELINILEEGSVKKELQEAVGKRMASSMASGDYRSFTILSMLNEFSDDTKAEDLSSSIEFDDLKGNHYLTSWQFFYNDADGIFSYNDFVKTFQSDKNWTIEDHSSFIRIYSKVGNSVEILSNKPEFEEEGIKGIEDFLQTNNRTVATYIHRGHSFDAGRTIEYIDNHAKFVFLGSCGGYYRIREIVERSSDVQVISTKQIGTYSINNPLIKSLSDKLRKGDPVIWNSFWAEALNSLGTNPLFKDYVPPNRNLSHHFINSYYHALGI